jgi:adenine-specific DNA-methyltransferase
LGPFFVDFCCFEERLVIEADGGQHAEMKDRDDNRTHYLAEQGFRVLRFWNNDILKNTDAVCEQILNELSAVSLSPRERVAEPGEAPHPDPLPQGEGETA